MYLIMKKGMNAEEVADVVDVCPHTIHQWVYYYNKKGPEGLIIKGQRGGNRSLMKKEDEIAFIAEIQEEAKKGIPITPRRIKEKIERKLGRSVSKDYPYDLLHRHGWKKISNQMYYSAKEGYPGAGITKKVPGQWQPLGKNINKE